MLVSSSIASKASPVTSKAPTVPTKAHSAVATIASIAVTIWYTGELVSVVVPVPVGVGEVSVGVDVREAVSLSNAHNAQTPEFVYKGDKDHREEIRRSFYCI